VNKFPALGEQRICGGRVAEYNLCQTYARN
jgi:hypothetical protein